MKKNEALKRMIKTHVKKDDKIDEEIFHKDRKIYFISFKNIDYLEELINS